MKIVLDGIPRDLYTYVHRRRQFRPAYLLESKMTHFVQASNGTFYTGRAGAGWLSANKAEAFAYSSEGAARKAELFNVNSGPLCGLTFKAVEAA